MVRAYGLLMRLYPRHHRAIFEKEMTAVFKEAAQEYRERGRVEFIRFALAEIAGAVMGAYAQWISGTRDQEDLQCVILAETEDACLPPEIALIQRRLRANLRQMEHAIAHHQFPRARFCSEVDRREREQLRQLRNKYGLPE